MEAFEGMFVGVVLATFLAIFWVDPPIKNESFVHATEVCQPNGGLDFIEEGYTTWAKFTCNNGAVFEYDLQRLKGD